MTKPSDGKGRGAPLRERARKERGRRSAGQEWIRSIVLAVLLFLLLRTFVVQTFVITSGSMENTLLVGDFVVVNRLAIGSRVPFTHIRIPGYSRPERGDVLIFHPPPPDDTTLQLVKRVIGMPGDTISMRHQVVYIDGKALREPYVKHTDEPNGTDSLMAWQKAYLAPWVDRSKYAPTRDDWGPLIIPPHDYFMMGDNREESFDSRYWGFVRRDRFEGRAEILYFSYDRGTHRRLPWIHEIRWGRIGRLVH